MVNLELQTGDIGAVKGRGILGFLHQKLFTPETDRYHYFIIWRRLRKDWIILESLSDKGLAIGLLSFYEREDVKLYRVNCPASLKKQAPLGLIEYGRCKYDRLLILKIIAGYLVALVRVIISERRLRRINAEELPYARNSALICTEAVDVAYLSVGVSIVGDVVPLPSAFKQAELNGVIDEVGILHEKDDQ
jgi:hypothetical protein